MHMFRLAAVALLPLIAAAQPATRSFQLIYTQSQQEANEVFTAVRTIADVRGTLDSLRQFTVEGTADQLRTAEWVLRQLDQPIAAPPAAPSTLRNIVDKYQEDTARVFYLPKDLSPQEFNEIQTCVRTITDIRRVYPNVSRRAIVLRGNQEAVDAAEWLIAELSRSASDTELVFPKNPVRKGDDDNHTRVFRLPAGMDQQSFNDAQTLVRTLTDTRRVYPYLGKRAIAMRGTREQLALSDWILAQLAKDLPRAQKAASSAYTTESSEVVRVFYFPGTTDAKSFVDAVMAFRGTTGIRRVGAIAAARVFAARGTAAQIAELATLAMQ